MGNKTIYVKDEALWERAKQLAGKEGLSALIGEALADFVERKEQENRGFTLHGIFVDEGPSGQFIRFYGRSLDSTLIGRGPDEPDAVAEVFQTKGAKLVLFLRDADSNQAYEHRTYDSLEELAEDKVFSHIPPDAREEFLESMAQSMGQNWSVWID